MILNIQVVLLITIINSYYIMLDSQLILKKFTLLINSFGFKTPKRFWHKNMVSFIKRLDDIHYCYIIIDAYKNNPVEVFRINLWIISFFKCRKFNKGAQPDVYFLDVT